MPPVEEILNRILLGLTYVRASLPLVIANPRAHPREAMLLAVIAALLLVLVVTIGMLVYDAVSGWRRNRRNGVRVRRRLDYRRLCLWVAAAILIFIALAQLPVLVSVSRGCGVCHAMDRAVATWEAGPHAEAGCYGCHAAPGIIRRVEATVEEFSRWGRIRRLGDMAPVYSSGCLRCHSEIEQSLVGTTVRVRHADLIAAGVACTDCHGEVGHRPEGPAVERLERAVMTNCLLCHDGRKAPAECEACHEGRPSDQASEPGPGVAAMRPDCTGSCHKDPDRCDDCHGLDMPHPEGFMREHARTSAKDPSLCTRCHTEASEGATCSCHIDGQTHGNVSAWYAQHGTQAAMSGPGGCRCHDNRGFQMCMTCHTTSPW